MLDKLYTNQFDAEQIWQQMDHKFQVSLNNTYVKSAAKLLAENAGGFDVQTRRDMESESAHVSSGSSGESDESTVEFDESPSASQSSGDEQEAASAESDNAGEDLHLPKGEQNPLRSKVICCC